jgi:hypothetical protein
MSACTQAWYCFDTAGNWYYINTAELAAAAGLPPQAPLVEVVTGAGDGTAAAARVTAMLFPPLFLRVEL